MSRADIVVGLGFGDEAKGATVDALAARHRPNRVVRFNGGAQAAHNVRAAGVHHTFASFGSAGLLQAPTWVAGTCAIDPPAARREHEALRGHHLSPALFVAEAALVTTALHVGANLAREAARGQGRHGSTGRGFGETVEVALTHPDLAPRAGDLQDIDALTGKLVTLAQHYASIGILPAPQPEATYAQLADQLVDAAKDTFTVVSDDDLLNELTTGYTIFEGAQGFWLDECYGFQPHTTWSTTTPAGARALARAADITDVRTIGCLRTYSTRHGAGPMPGEGELAHRPLEPDNADTDYAGTFRTGAHDPELLRTAIDVTMPDGLSISHTDVFDQLVTTQGPMSATDFAPVLLTAHGPARDDRHFTA